MKIYLDTCIFRDLKFEGNKIILESIIESKGELIYCFSEAHLYDLARDESKEKFKDMQFMEQIVDDNCYYYDKGILVDNYKPIEYFNLFQWPNETSATELITNFTEDNDTLSQILKSTFSFIPINLKNAIQENQIPADITKELSDMLLKPSNLYEFMLAMTSYSDILSKEQKKFKEQLKYLHKNQLNNEFKSLGIEGYVNNKITDKEKFRNSYINFFSKKSDNKIKYKYDLFIEMYSGLEFFGLVKGVPKKQKMLSMLNDSRHAFFGGYCDIVVSKDQDFINKTKFMYNLHEIDTQVFNLTEFIDFLINKKLKNSFSNLITEFIKVETQKENIIYEINNDDELVICRRLENIYFGYFNASINHSNGHIYFTKENTFLGTGTLVKEISFCVNQLIKELGVDYYGKGIWSLNEFEKDSYKNWKGRTWLINNTIVVDLKFSDRLYLIFGNADDNID